MFISPQVHSLLSGMVFQQEAFDKFINDIADVSLLYASQSPVHPQRLIHRHLINERVKLRAVSTSLLHLQIRNTPFKLWCLHALKSFFSGLLV